ncbi:MAG: hypothetical protein WAU79_19955, partial [Bradyrhizobium sp.]|uniref:hypothetical protein n=1 Tax=Bradyrhizobium sp. TaxID=376 RepID=UPI003BB05DE5
MSIAVLASPRPAQQLTVAVPARSFAVFGSRPREGDINRLATKHTVKQLHTVDIGYRRRRQGPDRAKFMNGGCEFVVGGRQKPRDFTDLPADSVRQLIASQLITALNSGLPIERKLMDRCEGGFERGIFSRWTLRKCAPVINKTQCVATGGVEQGLVKAAILARQCLEPAPIGGKAWKRRHRLKLG